MTDFQRGILILIKCAITGEPESLPEGFSIEAVEEFARRQNITTLVYDGAVKCGISTKVPAMQRMLRQYLKLMLHSEQQLAEAEKLFTAFDENSIRYLPLKGCNMKKRYPKPELRYMGDADILIKVEQYDTISRIMEEQGFVRGQETDHELPWRKENIHIELHKHLIPSYNKDYYAYFHDGWGIAEADYGNRYKLTPEDDFIFQFVHMAKHYRNGGIGCRYILDLWVMMRTYPDMDIRYIKNELDRLKLLEFSNNIDHLIHCWFNNGPENEKINFITDYIFSGGSWGTFERRLLTMGTNTAKCTGPRFLRDMNFLFQKLFPPLELMQFQYSVLKKIPFFLPLFWVFRLFDIVFFSPRRVAGAYRILTEASDEKTKKFYQSLLYVGLDFNFT